MMSSVMTDGSHDDNTDDRIESRMTGGASYGQTVTVCVVVVVVTTGVNEREESGTGLEPGEARVGDCSGATKGCWA
jgi:hypothetical protein